MIQQDMFGARSGCMHHGPGDMCPDCPERPGTTAAGFPHPQDAKGRRTLRRCTRCKQLITLGHWNVADWWHCLACVPLGSWSELGAARSPHKVDPKKIVR